MSITESELIDAIREAQTKTNDEGMTSDEIADLLACHRQLALKKLKALALQGKLIVGRRRDYRLDGVPCMKPVYRVAA